ncbi:MAG: anaerobic ribonucleoside-triphosphate reductase activating protein [Candidatus Thermoplasmatota archaeon]|nr:anaerobic ribonucleoside-triphosphate reductase activating protein [Candidatus Thermoplasmatota archaeon]
MFEGIKGFREASFLDWDGKVASVIFVGGCNFRCPFCQNYPLVFNDVPDYPFPSIQSFFEENRDFIDGVVITGGEPTVYKDIEDLCSFLKGNGFEIKLDTNGSTDFDYTTVDYVAMDVKASLEHYERAAGVKVNTERIKNNIKRAMALKEYEFRTTVVPGIIDERSIESIGKEIEGAKLWALQQFQGEHVLDESFKIKPYEKDKIMRMKDTAESYVREVIVRGI